MIEAFLDDTPGETRGVVVRDGRAEHLIIHRDGDPATHRLGARSVGRVRAVAPGLRGAFVELADGGDGFVAIGKGDAPKVGEAMEVETTAEPRGGKGPVLRRLASASGAPRLLAAGPPVADILSRLEPGAEPICGVEATKASLDAEDDALATRLTFPAIGLDLAVERTRALIAVDIDHAPTPGRDGGRERSRVNAEGLREAGRLIRLKSWGGLVVIDLAGTQLPPAVLEEAKAAFGPTASFGPLSRFGLLQLSLPWGRRPVEEAIADGSARAIAGVRRLRLALLTDTRSPRLTLVLPTDEAAGARPLVARLGPRAAIASDPSLLAGRWRIEEGPA